MTDRKRLVIRSRVKAISNSIASATNIACVLSGGLMVVVVVMGVFSRYAMQNAITWSEEIARMAMIWTTYLAISIAISRRGHLGVYYFVKKLPLFLQRLTKLVTDIMLVVFMGLLIIYGIKAVIILQGQVEPATGIVRSYPHAIIPLSAALMLIQQLLIIVDDLCKWGSKESPFNVADQH